MIQVYEIDTEGFYIQPVIIPKESEEESLYISIKPPDGLFKPKWDGEKWVEGLSQKEIDELMNTPNSQSPKEELTNLKLAIAELIQTYETDRIELQLAIAELASLISGGGD